MTLPACRINCSDSHCCSEGHTGFGYSLMLRKVIICLEICLPFPSCLLLNCNSIVSDLPVRMSMQPTLYSALHFPKHLQGRYTRDHSHWFFLEGSEGGNRVDGSYASPISFSDWMVATHFHPVENGALEANTAIVHGRSLILLFRHDLIYSSPLSLEVLTLFPVF